MGKLIIENRSFLNDLSAMHCVLDVIKAGRISNDGKQYCYATSFTNDIMVWTYLNKKSDRFVVVNYHTK